MLENGLIQVYTTESDETNFAPIGLSLRAAGQGLRSLIMCFTPYELMEGARKASSFLEPNILIDHSGIEQTRPKAKDNSWDIHQAVQTFQRSREAVFSGDFDIVILNGIHHVLEQGLLPMQDILALMQEKPQSVELVLSGPRASRQIIEGADLVTEMVVPKSKHLPAARNGSGEDKSIVVVTGNGKGKTTYCLGKGFLLAGLGIPALILQFIKSPRLYGEIKAIQKLPYLEIMTMGKGFLVKHSPYLAKKHKEAAEKAWKLWTEQIYSKNYGLLVLDEINIATHHGLISGERVREVLFLEPQKFQILLSGRNAHAGVMASASKVIEMREIKHPFRKGIKARRGIEF